MNGKGEWLRWLAALALGGLVGFFTDKGDMQERVAILETRYDRLAQDISEIKSDLKVLLRREP